MSDYISEIERELAIIRQWFDQIKTRDSIDPTLVVSSLQGNGFLPTLKGDVVLEEGSGIDIQVSGQSIIVNAITGSTLYLNSTNSSDIAGYERLTQTFPGNAEATAAASVTGANILIEEFATEQNLPGVTTIPGGVYNVHIHAERTAAGVATIKANIYKRTHPGAVETLLGTTESSSSLDVVETEYDLHVTLGDMSLNATDRLVVKIYGDKVSGGNPTVTIHYDGDTDARLTFPSSQGGLVVHTHETPGQGGTIDEDALALTDVTTNNSSTTKHGFLLKLSNATYDVMTGLGSWLGIAGNAFPGSPATGRPFFRTDLGWWCYYDGTRWLTTHTYHIQSDYSGRTFTANNNNAFLIPFRGGYAPYISRIQFETFVVAPNDGTNYWTMTFEGLTLVLAAVTIHTQATNGDTAATLTDHGTATMSTTPTPANNYFFNLKVAKTNAPGNLITDFYVDYRLIVT